MIPGDAIHAVHGDVGGAGPRFEARLGGRGFVVKTGAEVPALRLEGSGRAHEAEEHVRPAKPLVSNASNVPHVRVTALCVLSRTGCPIPTVFGTGTALYDP